MRINQKEMGTYIFVGLLATLVDWTTFAVSVKFLHYQVALLLALGAGSLTHYSSNKIYTFKCHSRKYGSQLSLYFLLVGFTILISMGIMGGLIKFLGINKISARILTTGLMLFPNYLLHKYITFSKRIFAQPAV